MRWAFLSLQYYAGFRTYQPSFPSSPFFRRSPSTSYTRTFNSATARLLPKGRGVNVHIHYAQVPSLTFILSPPSFVSSCNAHGDSVLTRIHVNLENLSWKSRIFTFIKYESNTHVTHNKRVEMIDLYSCEIIFYFLKKDFQNVYFSRSSLKLFFFFEKLLSRDQ